MPYQEIILLIPSHGLEDFPLHATSDQANGLLAGWTALWHPTLIAACGVTPSWRAAFAPPDMAEDRLFIVPEISRHSLPEGYLERAEAAGATIIAAETDRETIIAAALAGLDPPAEFAVSPDPELVADCLALGFCYLQVELLTRHMRYASNLDETRFKKLTLELATAAVQGSHELAREKLTTCYDMLAQERDHYYPVDVYLLDLTLLAPSTLGEDLRRELAQGSPQSLLAAGETIEALADEPASLAAVKESLGENLTLVGGELHEGRLPLMSSEAILARLRQGHAAYQKHLGRVPAIYGRRRYGLTPLLPNLLENLGYQGVFHATLDDGRFPRGSQAKVRWEGLDGWAIDTLARVPLDAAQPETWLGLAKRLAEAMDLDHIATLILAHWPDRTTPWHEDLRRINRYSGVLGKFVSLESYFGKTEYAGQLDRFRPDAYVSPYLRQDVAAGSPRPLSATVEYNQLRGAAAAAQTYAALAQLLGGEATSGTSELAAEVEAAFDAEAGFPPSLAAKLEDATQQAARALAARVHPAGSGQGEEEGVLVFNPCSFTRRVGLELPGMSKPPAAAGPVLAATSSGKLTYAVVELPPLGYAWVSPGGKATAKRRRGSSEPVAAKAPEGHVLRNEYFEAHIHPATGGLKSVYDYNSRGNRLSQLLGYRDSSHPADEETGPYGGMQVDKIAIEYANELTGRIVSRGRLLTPAGNKAADFEQSFTLWRGSRVLQLEIELKPAVDLRDDPWEDYFACRFAWADVAAHLYRNIGGVRQQTESRRIESPLYLQIDDASTLTTILSHGLSYHRRSGQRMLDTLLVVKGETTRRYQLGLAFDTPHVLSAALEHCMPPAVVPAHGGPPATGESGWLMHLDAKNVVATHWQPLADGSGFRACLQESTGKAGPVRLSAFKPLAEAHLLDFTGANRAALPIEEGAAVIELPAGGWVEVEARW